MCVSLGFVVLVFLEETKEWFWGYGERTKRARLSLSLVVFLFCCFVNLYILLLGDAVCSCGFVVDYWCIA
jgi:hypothetical protein